mmetsp:Transcript_83197/g.156565  ORF Transcript_83197/g.156565 Transcript_83197/m.156565 type:complete len:223 (+) Transcript_83197:1061-1729(+)
MSRVSSRRSPSIVPTKRPRRFVTASIGVAPGLIHPLYSFCPTKVFLTSAECSRRRPTTAGSVAPTAKKRGVGSSAAQSSDKSIQYSISSLDMLSSLSLTSLSFTFLASNTSFSGEAICNGGVPPVSAAAASLPTIAEPSAASLTFGAPVSPGGLGNCSCVDDVLSSTAAKRLSSSPSRMKTDVARWIFGRGRPRPPPPPEGGEAVSLLDGSVSSLLSRATIA